MSLLDLAAEALEDGRDPFSHAFLSEHNVTLNQCMDLADQCALGLRLLAWAARNPEQAQAAVEGATRLAAHEPAPRAASAR